MGSTGEWIARLEAAGVSRRFARGQVVVGQGEEITSLHIVRTGAVRLSASSLGGREVVAAVLGVGEVFGELAVLGGGPSPVCARAVEDALVWAIPRERLATALDRDPVLAAALLRLLAARLGRTSEALRDALLHDVSTRVSRRLSELARVHGAPVEGGVVVRLPLTQEDLARMVGASRETVNRSLASLAARGLVRSRGRRYVIPDPDALERLEPTATGATP